jgi:hypothetical protein
MSNYYFSAQASTNSHSSHNHHGGRSLTAFRARFEAGRSFDLDDDLEFCPGLLTEDDLQSIHSSSDRSSLSSGSPASSPLQQQIQPAQQVSPGFSLSTHSNPYASSPSSFFQPSQMKIHQTTTGRSRNAIPIVNPSTGMRVPSPPLSISPSRMQHNVGRRGW